jgi:hypothetical protein
MKGGQRTLVYVDVERLLASVLAAATSGGGIRRVLGEPAVFALFLTDTIKLTHCHLIEPALGESTWRMGGRSRSANSCSMMRAASALRLLQP